MGNQIINDLELREFGRLAERIGGRLAVRYDLTGRNFSSISVWVPYTGAPAPRSKPLDQCSVDCPIDNLAVNPEDSVRHREGVNAVFRGIQEAVEQAGFRGIVYLEGGFPLEARTLGIVNHSVMSFVDDRDGNNIGAVNVNGRGIEMGSFGRHPKLVEGYKVALERMVEPAGR